MRSWVLLSNHICLMLAPDLSTDCALRYRRSIAHMPDASIREKRTELFAGPVWHRGDGRGASSCSAALCGTQPRARRAVTGAQKWRCTNVQSLLGLATGDGSKATALFA